MPKNKSPRLTGYQAGQFKLKPYDESFTANSPLSQVNIIEISTFEHRRGMKRVYTEGVTL